MNQIFYLALVAKTDTTFSSAFARHDLHLKSFTVSHEEGDFCALSVEVENPGAALLDPGREQWAWLSMEEGTALTPLFFGRIVALPSNIQDEFVTLDFLARPSDFDAQKRAVAATLRAFPYWDPAFIDPQMWDDPDATMEARTDVWHIDRVTHDVTVSSIIAGEDGTISVLEHMIPEDGFELTYGEAPLRRVVLEMRAMWVQRMKGELDITSNLVNAFRAAGSPNGFATTYTGDGLWNDWPMTGDELVNVYTFGEQILEVADRRQLKIKFKQVKVKYQSSSGKEKGPDKVNFRRWGFSFRSKVNYEVEIERTEDIRFNVFADVQSVTSESDDELSETITMSSGAVGSPLGEGTGAEIPIGDVSRDTYWPLERGRHSIEFGLAHARALLVRRARAAEIKVVVPFEVAVSASLRKSATVHHPKIPGGSANGKIVAIEFGVDGDSGKRTGLLTVACMIGKNSALSGSTGSPTYISADYIGPDYQVFSGATDVSTDMQVAYSPPTSPPVYSVQLGVQSCTVINGEGAQAAIMRRKWRDPDAICNALNAAHTEVDLRMKVVDTSPKQITYYDTDAMLALPYGINLGDV